MSASARAAERQRQLGIAETNAHGELLSATIGDALRAKHPEIAWSALEEPSATAPSTVRVGPADDAARRLRIMVFRDRPEALLVVVPDGEQSPTLPPMLSPFTAKSVADALAEYGIKASITETIAGRWSTAAIKASADRRAEIAAKGREREAVDALLSKGAKYADIRERGEALTRKHEVDETLRSLKSKRDEAKRTARASGVFMSPADFRRLEDRIASLATESLALQMRLGELRKIEKARNRTEMVQRDKLIIVEMRKMLSEEQLAVVLAAVDEQDDGDDE